MKNDQFVSASVLVLFFMLWLPMGQYDFLIAHWMKIGTYAIPFLGIGIFAFFGQEKLQDLFKSIRFLGVLMLIAYILHQFEEHWIDLYGNVYAFYNYNNNFILSNLGVPSTTIKPLTKESIFVINTSLVWLVGSLAIWRSPKHIFPFFAMAGIIFVNGLVHIAAAIAKFEYNPGLLTSALLFLPLYFWIVRKTTKLDQGFKRPIIFGFIWAFLAHVIMVGGLLAANWFNVIPEYLYWMLLVLWSILPAILFKKK
ncbi:MAG: HXXEE domain-containing protein [Bacteroidota bacterium]